MELGLKKEESYQEVRGEQDKVIEGISGSKHTFTY
jgi:hypothetical protein